MPQEDAEEDQSACSAEEAAEHRHLHHRQWIHPQDPPAGLKVSLQCLLVLKKVKAISHCWERSTHSLENQRFLLCKIPHQRWDAKRLWIFTWAACQGTGAKAGRAGGGGRAMCISSKGTINSATLSWLILPSSCGAACAIKGCQFVACQLFVK